MPLRGPAIVAATHRSYLDPILISAFLPRTLYFMAKRELFANPVFGALIRAFGAFPVDRQSAHASTFHMALRILKQDGVVLVFPEGGITDSFNENRFKAGVGSLAGASGAPIVPLIIKGSEALTSRRSAPLHHGPLTIRVGPSIRPPQRRGRESRQETLRLTVDAIKTMTQALETP